MGERSRRRARTGPIGSAYRVAPALLASLVVAVAASCGSAPAPDGLAPPEAAASVARSLDLTPEQTACLRGRFEQAPSAAAALLPDEPPSDDDRDRFLDAMRACLPPDALGATLAATLQDEIPDATVDQAACVQRNVVALEPAEQDRLYLYFTNPAANDVDDVGQAGTDLFASCDLLRTTEATPDTAASTG